MSDAAKAQEQRAPGADVDERGGEAAEAVHRGVGVNARRRALLVALAGALALTAAGCDPGSYGGSGGNDGTAKDAVEEYLDAQSLGDGTRVCTMYSSRYRELVENDPDNESGASCEEQSKAIAERAKGERGELKSVDESGDRAVAIVGCEDSTASDCSLPLVREDDEWRIDGSLSPND